MEHATLRILDANLNRAREGLRVLEEFARFVLNDPGASSAIKHARHGLKEVADDIGRDSLFAARDTPGDVGTSITTASESMRTDAQAVARAASARVGEALRCIEEYGKLVSIEVARQVERLRYDLYSIEQALFITSPRRARLRRARLHVLLTESLCRKSWLETAEQVLHAGADVIQLREKSLSDGELLRRAYALRALTRRFNALLVVNDRPDIARLADADAVHLGQDDLPVADVRNIAGPTMFIGGSAHDRVEIERMLATGVDYLGVGPMFPSSTKPDVQVRGPDLLAMAYSLAAKSVGLPPSACPTSVSPDDDERRFARSESTEIPIVAIGGITAENIASLHAAETGPGGTENVPFAVAVCGAIIGDASPAEATRRLLAALGADRAPAAAGGS